MADPTTAQSADSEFGANAWIVEELYRDYLSDPGSVAQSWHDFFSDYVPPIGSLPRVASSAATQAADLQSTSQAMLVTPPTPTAEASPVEPVEIPSTAQKLRGVSATIADNMATSLSIPTATSFREVPAKLLEVNRKIVNNQLRRTRGGKVSFTHLIGWAMVKALVANPAMTKSYLEDEDGTPYVVTPDSINLGLAIDVERKGGRTLMVPNIKDVGKMTFREYWQAYEVMVKRVIKNDLDMEMFADTTATLTNPGGIGTVGSVPRLMEGQSAIIGVGAIAFPAQFKGADAQTLADLGIGKVITMTSTYDHRVIQGAESGFFLRSIEEFLLGGDRFYEEIFESLEIPYAPVTWNTDETSRISGDEAARAAKQIAVQKLTNMYRVRGHLMARLNPLQHTFRKLHPELDPAYYGLSIWDLDREFQIDPVNGQDCMRLDDLLGVLRDAYCGTIGVEYTHITDPEKKAWFRTRFETPLAAPTMDEKRRILQMLNEAEAFERFLGTKYLGQKRFSLEGAESLIPMLDGLLTAAIDSGIEEAVIGMAHRGRLNVLANILGKSYELIFSEFEGDVPEDSVQGGGDVKYHLGADGVHNSPTGKTLPISLAANPSHLEAVNPVVEGMVRAKLDKRGVTGERWPVLPILIHGDAAFAGQGVVAETLSMSQLVGYRTGGTVHVIVNNQLGFTTAPHHSRSSEYATDIAKMVQAPILHVNGDDPEACLRVVKWALEYRETYNADVVVDMVCYRKHGHNEGDEPAFTQPIMYRAINSHRSVRKLYTEELVTRGDMTIEEAEASLESFRSRLETALSDTREAKPDHNELPPKPTFNGVLAHIDTGVGRATLDHVMTTLTSWPEGFEPHPKLVRTLGKRAEMLANDGVDWATAEMLALGTLVHEGVPVRFAGQDSRRGTFSQRHSVLIDHRDAAEHIPLASFGPGAGQFVIHDSPLHEFGALGFEYGYSLARPEALTVWEAQFGDFSNGAQVIIDQFITAALDKWDELSRLVVLLPHGYEGQGPEHSSGRLERWMTLCAQDNIQVAQPSTAAQWFHLLRRQMKRDHLRPLIVFSPKSMLRAKQAMSPASAFEIGHFRETLQDPGGPADADVRRLVLCSGKIRHDLLAARDARSVPARIISVEQLYPFPYEQLAEAMMTVGTDEIYWVQDEPENMGPWPTVFARLHRIMEGLDKTFKLSSVTRFQSASPAGGSHTIHELELQALLDGAFEGL